MSGMNDMWAVTDWGKPLEKRQEPIPEPNGKEILIEVTHCGVCHSDLHFWEGFYDLGGGVIFKVKDRGVTLPRAIGHEILGKVVKLGPEAPGSAAVGSTQIVYPWLGCGKCRRCAADEDNLCSESRSLGVMQHGGFASYVIVPDVKYLADPGNVNSSVACTFGCSGLTTLSAVSKVMPQESDDTIVLVGAGGVGLAGISMLKAMGHRNILSVDISDEKLEAATKAGATAVVNSSKSDAAAEIKKIAGGPVFGAIDFVNNSTTAKMINGLMGKGGTWVQVGVMGGSVELSLAGNIFRGITIKSNLTGSPAHFQEVANMARGGRLPALPVVEMPWEEANKAMELLRDGKVTGRIVLVR